MKRIKKPLSVMLSFLLLLCVLSSAPFTAGAAESGALRESGSDESHSHDDVVFASWQLSDSLPAQAGDYMLTEDVTLTDRWDVPDGETNLCLNGHTIKQTADYKQVIYIGENSELNLFDCGGSGQITGGKGFYGGAVYIAQKASFTLNGGIIKGNEAVSGAGVFADKYASFVMNGGSIERNNRIFDNDASGGVYLFSDSTFVMNGGSISNNYFGDTGGGVTVGSGSAFTMNGGSISSNTNETSEGQGGGVYVFNGGSFTMNAGIISENTAEKGAGVYLDPGSVFTMSGGEISENEAFKSAGGVYYEDEAEFNLEGGVRITDNTVEGDLSHEDSNVYLADETGMQTLYIIGKLDDNAEIGVSTTVEEPDQSPVVFTYGLDGNGSSSNFTSDQLYDIVLDYNGEAVIGEGVTISFEKGYEYVTGSMSDVSWCKNMQYKLPACEYDSNGFYDFTGWKFGDNETIMQPNKTVRITDDVTITAQWFSGWKDLQEKIDNAESGETITLIANCTADYGDVSLTIPENKELTIDLNGHTIDRGLAGGEAVANGNVITNNGSLTITDSSTGKNGVITGGNNTGGGGGIHNYGELVIANGSVSGNSATYGGGIWTSKHLKVNGGFISGNTATDGGGIFFGGGTAYPLEINGGEIKNNSASGLGGGIFTSDDATVTGGVISGNTAKQGGGIYNSGRLDISGGTVSNNTATEYGGGIYDEPSAGTAYLRDTTITGNTASQGGGIYTEGRRIHLSGAPQVTGNKKNDNSDNNLFISDKMKMYVDDSFSSEANIGVSVTLSNVVSAVLTDGLAQSGATYEAFTSDDPKRTIIDDGNGEAAFVRIYNITTQKKGKGTLTVDKTKALAGETVTVTATPNEGYVLTSLQYNNDALTGNTFIVPSLGYDYPIIVYAVFSIKTYTVTWQNEDGTELEVDENVEHFSTPSYDGTAPSKEGWRFVGWDDGENIYAVADLPRVTGNVAYKAVFAINTYTVTWQNEDGTLLEKDEDVPHGATPVYNGTTPTKESTVDKDFTFSGWSPEVSKVTCDITYTAQYTATVRKYTVTWMDGDTVLETDENVPYGTMPEFNGTNPTKESTVDKDFTFSGWSPDVSKVTGDITYTAQYTATVRKYTVIWKDGDTVLETDENVPYGTTPEFNGTNPTKESTVDKVYTFSGWSPEVSAVTGDITYTAQFTSTVRKYTVIWMDGETELEKDENVPYGTTPEFNGTNPTRESTVDKVYTFSGWSPEVSEVAGDITYTAQFTESARKYTVTWKNYDGNVITTSQVAYGSVPSYKGSTPTRECDNENEIIYGFSGWTPTLEAVTGDCAYTAEYTTMPFIPYVDAKGNPLTLTEPYKVIDENTVHLENNKWYVLTSDVTNENRLIVDGKTNIILCDGATLTDKKGITVEWRKELTIWQQEEGTGAMRIINGTPDNYAGIGGAAYHSGKITINGGDIIVTGGNHGAGIGGGGSNRAADVITINGGKIEAVGNTGGSGIGSGSLGDGTVVINGGTVNAKSYGGGSGIGGGKQGYGIVRINGGTVTAEGFSGGSGIGGGGYAGCTVTINGGNVTATGNIHAAGIGSGTSNSSRGKTTITINGGTVTVPRGGSSAAGIGTGYKDTCGGTVTINGGIVKSKAGDGGFGTGSGNSAKAIDVYLNYTDENKDTRSQYSSGYNGIIHIMRPFIDQDGVIYGVTDSADTDNLKNKTLTPFDSKDEQLVGYTLSLEGDIGVNFYMELKESIANSKTAYMHFTIPKNGELATQDVFVKDARQEEVGDKTYYVFKCQVAAKEMTSQIKARIMDGEYLGTEYTYSVRDYADYLLEHAAEREDWTKAVPLVKAMLNYGAYSQINFDKNPTNLANIGLTEKEKTLGNVTIDIADPDTDGLPEGVTFEGATLSLKSETTLSLYFKSNTDLEFSCGDYFVQDVPNGEYQVARIRGIKAKKIGDIFTLKVNGTTVQYSPLNYCKNVLTPSTVTADEAQPQDEKLVNVVKALVLYWQAADSYFD